MDAYAPTSATSSCSIGIDDEELETHDDESDELDTDTQGIRYAGSTGTSHGSGGQPPISGKKRLRTKRSSVWNHFTKDINSSEDFPTANCNYCGRQYKYHPTRNDTSNMLYHVKNCQKYKCFKAKEDSSQSKFTFMAGESQSGGASGNNLIVVKYSEKLLRETLCEMIIVDEFSFSVVEKMGIKKMFRVLEPRFKLPSRYAVMNDCIKLFMSKKDIIKKKLLMAGQRVCLTIDTWTSIQNMNYMVVTGHFIDPTWKYHKRILAFRQLSDHKAITITKEIEQCLVEWGINRLLAITLDNASANDKAISEYKKRNMSNKDVICHHEFVHIRCCVHVLNLIVQEGTKDVHDSIERIRNMVKYVKGSPQRLALFKSCVERKQLGCKSSLKLDVPARWNSTYTMLEVAQKYERAFDLMLDEDLNFFNYLNDDSGGKDALGAPTENDWKKVRYFVKFLRVFYEETIQMSGSSYSTSNLFFNILQKVYHCLTEYCESDDYLLSSMATKMKGIYDKYWGDFEAINPLFFLASVLDPRYKISVLEFWLQTNVGIPKAKKIVDNLKSVLDQLYQHYAKNVEGSGDRVSNKGVGVGTSFKGVSTNKKDALTIYHSFLASKNAMMCQTEIEQYCTEEVETPSKTFDILMWWRVNKSKFPVLSEIARDVLAIPLTSVASESAFSIEGRIIDPFRSSLAPKTMEALICCQNWLRSSPNFEYSESLLSDIEDEESYKLESEILSNSLTFDAD